MMASPVRDKEDSVDTCVTMSVAAIPGPEGQGRKPGRRRKRRTRLAPRELRAAREAFLERMALTLSILDHGELDGRLERGEITGLRAVDSRGKPVYACGFTGAVSLEDLCFSAARICLLDVRIDCVTKEGGTLAFLPPPGSESRRFAPP